MVTRKTQYGWMAAGGLICLFALVLACKLRDGARAAAQGGPSSAGAKPASETKAEPPKKEESEPIPLTAPGNPLPPIDTNRPSADPEPAQPPPLLIPPPDSKSPEKKAAVGPAPIGVPKLQATMPLPVPLEAPTPVIPAGYSLDPVAGAAGTDTVVPPPGISVVDPLSIPPPAKVEKTPNPQAEKAPPVKLGPPPAAERPEPHPSPVGMQGFPPSPTFVDVPAPGVRTEAPRPTVGPPPAPTWTNPATPPPVESAEAHPLPGEPPLAPSPGPVQTYQVRSPETMRDLARRTLGAAERWTDIHKLNPLLKPETTLAAGTVIRLPGDACVTSDEAEPVKPLPAMHPKAGPARPKVVLPLTGTYPANLDDKKTMTLPAAIREQLTGADTVLVSPGPDQCLWLTNQEHLERLAQRLEQSPAREIDVRVFKRLYYAQTEKTALNSEGRVTISERLAQFAGLHQEVILVGIDDHFELWDAGRWRQYTQQKSGGRSSVAEQE